MSASVFLRDREFDALVEALEALSNRGDQVHAWEIRVALGGHGVLPTSALANQDMQDDLIASLRSVCASGLAKLEAA